MYKVIKYGATWCSQCKLQDREFNKNPLNCPFEVLDVDDLSDEKIDELAIKSMPVTFLYKDNVEIHRWNGFVKSEEINKLIE